MDIAGDGGYFEVSSSKEYIRRSDCLRLRKLPPIIDDDLHVSLTESLTHNLGRDAIIPHIFANPLPEAQPFPDLPLPSNEEKSIEATIAAFRWVPVNGEGAPLEQAYKDPWLQHLYNSDSDGDSISNHSCRSTGEGSQDIGSCVESCTNPES